MEEKRRRPDNVWDVDELAAFFGLPSWSEIEEHNFDYRCSAGAQAASEARAADPEISDERADEVAREAEDGVGDELFGKWHAFVVRVAEEVLGEHGLALRPHRPSDARRRYPHQYRIVPARSWRAAAGAVLETVNGYGMFVFGSLREFLASGPYTARQAVIDHIGWVRQRHRVFGSQSPQALFHSAWR